MKNLLSLNFARIELDDYINPYAVEFDFHLIMLLLYQSFHKNFFASRYLTSLNLNSWLRPWLYVTCVSVSSFAQSTPTLVNPNSALTFPSMVH